MVVFSSNAASFSAWLLPLSRGGVVAWVVSCLPDEKCLFLGEIELASVSCAVLLLVARKEGRRRARVPHMHGGKGLTEADKLAATCCNPALEVDACIICLCERDRSSVKEQGDHCEEYQGRSRLTHSSEQMDVVYGTSLNNKCNGFNCWLPSASTLQPFAKF